VNVNPAGYPTQQMLSRRRKRLVIWITQAADLVETLANVPCLILGACMVVVVISGVIARYVIQNPMSWTEEVARFLMNWMALLGVSIVARHRAHLSVLYFVCQMPICLQRLIKLITDCLIMVFLYFLIVYGIRMVMDATLQIEPVTGISMHYILLCVPLCGFLTLIQLSFQVLVDLIEWGTAKSPFTIER
jgi:TRAP-type transport system small permease protein